MSMITIAAAGVAAVLTAVQLRSGKGEYGVYVVLAAGLFIFFYGASKLAAILKAIEEIRSFMQIGQPYLEALLKMIGITYVAEFAAGMCRDAGYGYLGSQIEIFGKLSILALSMPILLALFGTLEQFLQ